jgi:small-conductance mechanosensitive channel
MVMIDLGQEIPYIGIKIFQVLTAIIILIVGLIAAKIINAVFKKQLGKTKLPELVVEFLARFLSSLLYVMVILLTVAAVGVEVGSVVLGLSAVIGLILGFGLQDTMTNLLAGVWLAALRPIDKGEVVTTNGETGTVDAIGMMATEILSFDNKFITIPNKLVWGSVIVNYTRMPTGVMKTPHIRVSSPSQHLAIFVPFCQPFLNRQSVSGVLNTMCFISNRA